jgi:uncharacterized protein YbaR (Trm112 family)
MALDPLLIDILVCPIDKETLLYFEEENLLYNPRTKTAYAVNDGIPVLLPNEGRVVDDDEAQRLDAKASSAVVTGAPKSDTSPN